MFRPLLLLAGLGGVLASGPGFHGPSVQIVVPEKIQRRTESEGQISYVIPIDNKPYVVHLNKSYFLADHFMVYLYNQGSVSSQTADNLAVCYYQGYVEGYPNSVVTISTCSGLRGTLQFEDVSYGIQPLESSVKFQHVIYKSGNENNELESLDKNSRSLENQQVNSEIFVNENPKLSSQNLPPLYLEMHIVVDKALYNYFGSDSMVVTTKIIEAISLVNSVFAQLKVSIVLSSLEMWSDGNKISTDGEADELLYRFLEWKQPYLILRPHDIAYLLIYSDYPDYVGAAFPGKMCVTRYSAGIIMFPKGLTLVSLSVIVTQMLGLSLGMSYDDPMSCHCSKIICIMNPKAMQFTGIKTFSDCSQSAFESFVSNMGAKCLQNKPQMQVSPGSFCGNKIVEGNEVCDCGTPAECGTNNCCDPQTCMLKRGNSCISDNPDQESLCCEECQFSLQGRECRPSRNQDCDVPEVCNGSSGSCPPDVYIHSGNVCKNKYICYEGYCHDLDERCERHFGKGARNAPFACYEEIQGQTDRFGNCGKDKYNRFVFCGWRNLLCGRLICTYPSRIPYLPSTNTSSVIYAYVRDKVCITEDFGPDPKLDKLRIQTGPECDTNRICVNSVCIETSTIRLKARKCNEKCSGNGVCTSVGTCRCFGDYLPPNCRSRSKASELPVKNDLIVESPSGRDEKKWLLSLYIALSILIMATLVAAAWIGLNKWLTIEEESQSSKSKSEGNTHTSGSISEDSTPEDTSRSKSKGNTETHSSSNK
uniref:disintegrin and metalloproteinase domain-containing protein 32 n=1 Tax=Jaculus jaculus TaxID=51337 RepID=UPI001E1B1E57|nr:disintegrin and metalloproteinase domain-containing protein 32 [Jaculus jaculus]